MPAADNNNILGLFPTGSGFCGVSDSETCLAGHYLRRAVAPWFTRIGFDPIQLALGQAAEEDVEGAGAAVLGAGGGDGQHVAA